MRYSRVFLFALVFFSVFALCSAKHYPTAHGVKASYEASSDPFAQRIKPLIVLDAGHGGSDEGTKVNALMEKRLSLITTLLTKTHLEELGYRVILTRSKDAFVSLSRRVLIANKAQSSLFVSIHFNSAPSVEAKGIEIFYYNAKEIWRARASKRLASCILNRIISQTEAKSRGVKQGNFHVIRETSMPAVLVEGGFLTNKDERIKLRERDYLDRLSIGIAQGIDRYMKM